MATARASDVVPTAHSQIPPDENKIIGSMTGGVFGVPSLK